LRLNIAWPTTVTEKSIPSRAAPTTVTPEPSRTILHHQILHSVHPTFLQAPWLLQSLYHPSMTLAVMGRRLQLRVVAILQTRGMHLPMLSTVTRLLASSLHQANLSSISHLFNLSPTPDLQPTLLPHQINEVIMMTADLRMGRSHMRRTPTMLTIAASHLQDRRQMATVIILVAFMSTLPLGLAMGLLSRRQPLVKEHQLLADTVGRERFVIGAALGEANCCCSKC
jgi:hypothetical protein